MTREVIGNTVHLTSESGIKDVRTDKIHHEVVCSLKTERYFAELEENNND